MRASATLPSANGEDQNFVSAVDRPSPQIWDHRMPSLTKITLSPHPRLRRPGRGHPRRAAGAAAARFCRIHAVLARRQASDRVSELLLQHVAAHPA